MNGERAELQDRLARMITGYWLTQAVHAAARLGVAEALAAGPRRAEEVAAALGAHPRALYRLMRGLSHLGLLEEAGDHRFALTELGALLRGDVPGSMKASALFHGAREHYGAWGALVHSVRTGETAFDHAFGRPVFDHLAGHPEEAAIFDQTMAAFTERLGPLVAAAAEVARFQVICDVGGGSGALLAALLEAAPKARGILADLPHVVERARAFLEARGLATRVERRGVDFFREVPAGADAYVMKWILHDWEDAKAAAILATVRRACGEEARLLVVESVVPPPGTPSRSRMGDVNMLVMTGGCERTEAEWRALLAAGGFRLERIVPFEEAMSVLEARPG